MLCCSNSIILVQKVLRKGCKGIEDNQNHIPVLARITLLEVNTLYPYTYRMHGCTSADVRTVQMKLEYPDDSLRSSS